MSTCRWVVLKVVITPDGAKASEILGPDLEAPDRPTALERARRLYPVKDGELTVVSRLSWDMSMEERERLDRRRPAHMGRLVQRAGGAPRTAWDKKQRSQKD